LNRLRLLPRARLLELDYMNPDVSVVMCARNAEKYIRSCIGSILNQTFQNFEIVLVDDMSSDNTANIITKFNDKRIIYVRNTEWLKISKSRNRGIEYAKGRYIFFTDSDCTVSPNWIEEGLRYLEQKNCVGVEGKIVYVSEDYEPTFSDHVMENKFGGQFMTGNEAYTKNVILAAGGFDEKMGPLADRDFGLTAMKYGKILFNPNMIVHHPRVTVTPAMLIKSAPNIRERVLLFKKHGEKKFTMWRILFPSSLAKALFPPLTFASLFFARFQTADDFRLLPYTYIYVILARLQVWKTSVTERVFLI
jgi:glycosyltransferase involved in cell wall biosynthesis